MKQIAVVSLANEYARREHINRLFKEHNLDFRYFDAIDKTQVEKCLQKYRLLMPSKILSKGEIACYLSHYCLWQQVIEQNLPYLIFFEDDIYFSKSANELLSYLDWLPTDFDVIKLETMNERVMVNRGTDLAIGHNLCRMRSRHMGTAGYIISQSGAQKLISTVQKFGIDRPVDHLIFDELIKQSASQLYQLYPALCIQDKIHNEQTLQFTSCFEEERPQYSARKPKLNKKQKAVRELIRLWSQMQIANFYRSLLLTLQGYQKRKIEFKD